MAAASSSGTNQQFTLDHSAFEKLLSAAWVLQCLHDQLHDPHLSRAQAVVEPVEIPKRAEPSRSDLQVVMESVVHPSPRVTESDTKHEVLGSRPADDETLAELVEAQQAIETGTLDLHAAMRRVVALSLRLTQAEGAAIWLFTRDEFTYRAGAGTASDSEKLRLAVLSSLAGTWPGNGQPIHPQAPALKQSWVADLSVGATSLLVAPIYHGREVAGALGAFTKRSDSFSGHDATAVRLLSGLLSHALGKAAEAAPKKVELKTIELKPAELKQDAPAKTAAVPQPTKPFSSLLEKATDHKAPVRRASSFDLRTVFSSLLKAPSYRRAIYRVNFTLRGLQAIAIATPVWLLSLVAALLLLEAWRHQPFQSAQAISAASPSTAEASVSTTQPARTTSTRVGSEDAKKPENVEPRRPTPIPPLAATHEQITDPATLSVVYQLSRYEISGLRRQAKYGDDSAALTLGMAYEVGRYVTQNCVEAARWVRAAAEEGNSAAQYNLGLRYRDGDGVAEDRAESEKWLRKAAAQRNRQAKLALRMLASR